MSFKRKMTLSLTAGAIIALYLWFGFHPLLWMPKSLIRSYLLQKTPLGTDIERVRTYTDKRGWRDHNYVEDGGFSNQDLKPNIVVGKKSIRGSLGDYRIVFLTNVTAFWGFDENGKLIDVWIWETTDGL